MDVSKFSGPWKSRNENANRLTIDYSLRALAEVLHSTGSVKHTSFCVKTLQPFKLVIEEEENFHFVHHDDLSFYLKCYSYHCVVAPAVPYITIVSELHSTIHNLFFKFFTLGISLQRWRSHPEEAMQLVNMSTKILT